MRAVVQAMNGGDYRPSDVPVGEDEIGQLGLALRGLAQTLRARFGELEALVKVTQEINAGLLLEEVLDKIFESFRPIIPYDRIGFALLENNGRTLRAHWARSDAPQVRLYKGYAAPMEGSSLQQIMKTGRPRILNDLGAYLLEHPLSDSTRRIVEEGMQSSLTCPLIALGIPIGFLFFSSMEPDTYASVHVELFQQIAGQLATIVEKSNLYEQLLEEEKRAERLLLNVLPKPVAERLKAGAAPVAEAFAEATVLFADIVGFTELSSRMAAPALVRLLDDVFSQFDELCEKHRVEKIKTIGDAYMIASGLPTPRPDHVAAAAAIALDMLAAVQPFSRPDGTPLRLRIGIHTGPVVAGVIGKRKFIYDLWGDTVNVASRMESQGVPDRIQVTEQVERTLADEFILELRGPQPIRGKGEMTTYFVTGRK